MVKWLDEAQGITKFEFSCKQNKCKKIDVRKKKSCSGKKTLINFIRICLTIIFSNFILNLSFNFFYYMLLLV